MSDVPYRLKLYTTHDSRLTFYHFSNVRNWKGIEAKSRRLLPLTCLPVDDILDVVMHALVVSSSVGLEVKSHLGKKGGHKRKVLLVSIHHLLSLNITLRSALNSDLYRYRSKI